MTAKRMKALKELIDPKKVYTIDEALDLVKQTAKTKFDEGIELHIRLGIDPAKSEQQIRGTVVLPHGTGKTKRIAAFVEPEKEAEAKKAGADIIGDEEVIAEIVKSGKIDFDVAVATPAMMPKLAKLARLLGPRGLMPNPKTDTIGPNIEKIIIEQKGGKVSFKNDAGGNIHQVFGKASFDTVKLKENFQTSIESIRKLKPTSTKGAYIKNISIASTMGPGIKVEL